MIHFFLFNKVIILQVKIKIFSAIYTDYYLLCQDGLEGKRAFASSYFLQLSSHFIDRRCLLLNIRWWHHLQILFKHSLLRGYVSVYF